ncbi:poly-gamma-glutamate system protein [candidate division KSB1 bacterium]|nr:poly-gamma-glutamate system protein [candidate division KSB1 bacterium]
MPKIRSMYRPTIQSVWTLIGLAVLAVLLLLWALNSPVMVRRSYFEEKLTAAELMKRAGDLIRQVRLEKGVFIDQVNDPNQTALIGEQYTPITTDRGLLDAKLTVLNPNFAAVVVQMMKEVGLGPGDQIAVALTGSMPGANLAVLAASEVLDIVPIIITSVGASQWGANDPHFTWLDMEHLLVEKGIFSIRSAAASLGGGQDMGRRLTVQGRVLLRQAVERNELPLIHNKSLEENIEERLRIYRKLAGKRGIKVYINVGGGAGSLGHSINGRLIRSGVTKNLEMKNYPLKGAMIRLAEQGIPLIHILNINRIVSEYGLPIAPVPLPEVGEGKIFADEKYDPRVTWAALLILLSALGGVVYSGHRVHRLQREGVEPDSLL